MYELDFPVADPITNDLEADQAITRINEAKAQIDTMTAWYKQALDKIKEQQTAIINAEMDRLADYFRTIPHHKTETQESYTLPSGKLVWKQQDPEWKRDEKEIIKWAKENHREQYIKVSESIDWQGLKKSLTALDDIAIDKETGKRVPGVTVIQRDNVFTIGK